MNNTKYTANTNVFSNICNEVLDYWSTSYTFETSISIRNEKEYVFYDGPPFANGLPHYGHILTGFIKDVFARYHTMIGEKVERKFGWDCHGLPAEMECQKILGISGRLAILEYGIDKFNDACRTSVLKYTHEWQDYVTRQARWVDFKNSYKTMDIDYMESVLWSFKNLYDRGLIYEAMKVLPYSWKCQTPLSNFETRMDNSYREKVSKSVVVKFELSSIPEFIRSKIPYVERVFLLCWTTTPWTLPSNLAIAVNKDISYAMWSVNKDIYICSHESYNKYVKLSL